MSGEQKDETVVRMELDTEDLSADQLRILSAFGLDDDEVPERRSTRRFDSLDELLEFERHQDEGIWREWPSVKGSRVLLAHPEAAALAFPANERKVRDDAGIAEGEQTPAALIIKAAGLSAFSRSVRDWEIVLGGKPLEFNRMNFLMMWRVRPFREFLADEAALFRERPEALSPAEGKD